MAGAPLGQHPPSPTHSRELRRLPQIHAIQGAVADQTRPRCSVSVIREGDGEVLKGAASADHDKALFSTWQIATRADLS